MADEEKDEALLEAYRRVAAHFWAGSASGGADVAREHWGKLGFQQQHQSLKRVDLMTRAILQETLPMRLAAMLGALDKIALAETSCTSEFLAGFLLGIADGCLLQFHPAEAAQGQPRTEDAGGAEYVVRH